MKSQIDVYIDDVKAPKDVITFSAGEVHTNMDLDVLRPKSTKELSTRIEARIVDANGIMELLQTADILTRWLYTIGGMHIHEKEVVIPYMPYSRQDRVCAKGDAAGLQLFADSALSVLSNMGFKLLTWDMHSGDGFTECVRTVRHISLTNVKQHRLFAESYHRICERLGEDFIVVSPDEGALHKSQELFKRGFGWGIARGGKVRNPSTGKLTGFTCSREDFHGKNVIIVDDICDGGGTFLGLASLLKERNCGKIFLYVTHGIFSKGLTPFSGLISEIFTTDSIPSGYIDGQVINGVRLNIQPHQLKKVISSGTMGTEEQTNSNPLTKAQTQTPTGEDKQ